MSLKFELKNHFLKTYGRQRVNEATVRRIIWCRIKCGAKLNTLKHIFSKA